MESSQSSSFDPFISKKTLHSSSTPSPSDQTMTKAPDQSLCISKTPEKPINPQCRMKNRPAALSVKELTQAAKKFPKSDSDSPSRSDSIIGIAKQQNASWQSETAVSKSEMADGSIKLPEKYNLLDKFFNSLDSSIRLLRLKGSMPTFTNISPKIEYLTDRRFTYDLAQLKFILPEVIEVKKVLTHDEQTSCMKPDLHVSLNADAIEDDGKLKSESVNSWLRKVFRSRLLHFSEAHPKGDEVPRGTLPHPFNQLKQDTHKNKIKATKSSLACEISGDALLEQQPAAAAGHLSQSFRRHFLQQGLNQEAVNTTQMPSIVSLRSSVLPVSDPYFDECSSRKEISAAATPFFPKSSSKQIADEECIKPGASATSLPPSHTATTPVKKIDSTMNEDYSPMGTVSIEGTPAKLISTPAKLMSVTPGLQPPKRCCMSPDDDSTRSPNILARRPPRSRSLKFDTPVKSAKFEDEVNDGRSISVDSDIFDILSENLLESIREKERKMLEDQDPAISQAKWRQQMITNLPKLFDSIHFVFQAISCSVITKEELMHKITASHLDIVDRREIEDQLRLLQELVPEWIYEKSVSSGDLLLCINKIISPESIHIRLAEAI